MSGSLQPTNESRNGRDFGVFTDFCSMIFASLFVQFTAPGRWGVGSNPVCCLLLATYSIKAPRAIAGASLKVKQKDWGSGRLIAGIMYDLYVL